MDFVVTTYGFVLFSYWDELYPEQSEITSTQLFELGFGKSFGWGTNTESEVLEQLSEKQIIRLNKQLMPYTVLRLADLSYLTNNLYSELC